MVELDTSVAGARPPSSRWLRPTSHVVNSPNGMGSGRSRSSSRGVSGSNSATRRLGIVLAHELLRLNSHTAPPSQYISGGLAGWQQKRLVDYIEEHLASDPSLPELAAVAGLSPYHFARMFKQSFGLPPHRYLTSRRIEKAKRLLAKPALSVTRVGFDLGFSELSSFTSTFHKLVGVTPTDYRRSL